MKLKDWADKLIWATVLISVVRYAAAFAASDLGEIIGWWSNILTFMLSITGVGMGFLDTVGGGLLFNGWSRVFPKSGQKWSVRFIILTICVFGLLVSGLIILVPFTMSRLAHESVLVALGGKTNLWAWVWSTMVNLIPYILIAGVFVGNKMVVSLESEESSESSKTTSGSDGTSETTSRSNNGSFKTGRPSIHQQRVFSYLEKQYKLNGTVPTFSEVANNLELPQSTASRLRNEWINSKRK